MYQQYLADPDSVDQAWHEFFADYRPGSPVAASADRDAGPEPAAAPRTAPSPSAPLSGNPLATTGRRPDAAGNGSVGSASQPGGYAAPTPEQEKAAPADDAAQAPAKPAAAPQPAAPAAK